MSDLSINKTNSTRRMVYTALMTALVFVATYAIRVPVPFTSGYIHPGDSMVFLSGLLLGPFYGAFAAGIGSSLADIIAGYTFWAFPTLIIKALMALVVGYFAKEALSKVTYAITGLSGLIWTLFILLTSLLLKQPSQGNTTFTTTLDLLSSENMTTMTSKELTDLISSTGSYLIAVFVVIIILAGGLLAFNKFNKKNTLPTYIALAYISGGIIMIVGYYLTYGVLVGNYIVPIFSIPSNMLQFIGGFIIASLLTPVILMIKKRSF